MFWRRCYFAHFVFKFLLRFLVCRRIFSFIQMEHNLYFRLELNLELCLFSTYSSILLNQQKRNFCPNLSYDLVAFTWRHNRMWLWLIFTLLACTLVILIYDPPPACTCYSIYATMGTLTGANSLDISLTLVRLSLVQCQYHPIFQIILSYTHALSINMYWTVLSVYLVSTLCV